MRVITYGHNTVLLQQTLERWATVFYIATGVSVLGYFVYFFFGSVEEQEWNNPGKKDLERKEDQEKNVI